jgi:hypothetical protein
VKSSKPLSKSNPYLRNAAVRDRLLLISVATSSAVEGIRAPFKRTAQSGKGRVKASVTRKKL